MKLFLIALPIFVLLSPLIGMQAGYKRIFRPASCFVKSYASKPSDGAPSARET
jgi:hypothetical protein